MIILLGEGCQITWDFDKLKIEKERSIFEWFLSVKFTDILYIIKKIHNNEQLEITTRSTFPGNIFLDTTDIRSSHYTPNNFKDILQRRTERFIKQIKSNEKIIFVRYEHHAYNTTKDDIKEFDSIIKQINPGCIYKLLLFANRGKKVLLENTANFSHIEHTDDIDLVDKYIKSC